MAKENEFRFKSATVDPRKGIDAGFDLQTGEWQAMQDVDPYLKHVKLERENQDYFGKTKHGYRKMATIPDIVAIKINEDHGIDLHSQTFMNDKDKVKRLRYILTTEYPDLLVNT